MDINAQFTAYQMALKQTKKMFNLKMKIQTTLRMFSWGRLNGSVG